MSVTVTDVTDVPRVIQLTNGKSFTFQSNEATTIEQIPTIDVSRMYSDNIEDRKAVAAEVREAAHTIGFLTLVNHRVDMTLAADVRQQARDFFALPLERKMAVCTDLLPDEYCGYHPMERHNPNGWKKKDLYEAFNWNYSPSNDPDHPDTSISEINLWPADLPAFKSGLLAYQAEMIKFARKLTQVFALALNLDEHAFDSAVYRPEAGARILRYPAQNASRNEQQGIGAHTDVEHFTIITSETEGLEVLSKTGNWMKVKPVQGSFVLNIADCFMRQTNDFFVSTVHRVINETGRERYSVPFFWGLDRKTVLEPIEGCVTEETPNKYEVMTAGEYYLWRTRKQKVSWRVGDGNANEAVQGVA